MLTDELSPAAARLYERLLAAGPGRVRTGDGEPAAVAELLSQGFALVHGTDQLSAVEPAQAAEHLLARLNDRIAEGHRQALRLRSELGRLARGGAPADDDRVQVLTDADQIRRLSGEIFLAASQEILLFNTEHFAAGPGPARGLPPEWFERGIAVREVYTRAYLEDPVLTPFLAADGPGHQIRITAELPIKLVLVDERAALVPLDPTGMTGALLVRAPVVLAALRTLFEQVWREARPYRSGAVRAGDGPDPDERRLLDLLLTGAKDEAVARSLDVSVRTLRRRVAALERRFGAGNRLAMIAAAARTGWLE
jgi:DNA-binding CsgD family transcriptional regulator